MTIPELVIAFRAALLDDLAGRPAELPTLWAELHGQGDAAVPELAALLGDPDGRVTEAAADLLEAIGTPLAVEWLVRYAVTRLHGPEGDKGAGAGQYRLLNLGAAALPALARLYPQVGPLEDRLALVHLAHQIGDPAARPLLDAALAEADSLVAGAAAEALGATGDPAAVDRLVPLLEAPAVKLRAGAVAGLALLGQPAAIAPLAALLEAPDAAVPQWASASAMPPSLHDLAAQAIDRLAGEPLGGDPARIRAWLANR